MKSGTGVSDRVEIHAPGIHTRDRDEWLSLIPNCTECGTKMEPIVSWRGRTKPKIRCVNGNCGLRNIWRMRDEW